MGNDNVKIKKAGDLIGVLNMTVKMLKTELKKICYARLSKIVILIMLAVYSMIICYCVETIMQCDGDLEGMNSHIAILCADIDVEGNSDLVTNTNIFGYILGMNDWGAIEFFEMYRTTMFSSLLIALLFTIYFVISFGNEFSGSTLRQQIFYGIKPLHALWYKYIVNSLVFGICYLIGNVVLWSLLTGLLGFEGSISYLSIIILASLLNILCFMALASLGVLMVTLFQKISLAVGISISWILFDHIFYLGCVTDIWNYGKTIGYLLIANPGTYMYKINNYGLGINSELISQIIINFTITLIGVWGILAVYLRKREF